MTLVRLHEAPHRDSTVFDEDSYAQAFVRYRHPAGSVLRHYLDLFRSALPTSLPDRPLRILDVGAGTGAFAVPIANGGLGVPARIHAVEPSMAMLRRLDAALSGADAPAVALEPTTFEDWYLDPRRDRDERFDLVICSQVAHLVPDLEDFVNRVLDTTAPGGAVVFRAATHEQLGRSTWYRGLPRLLAAELARPQTVERLRPALAGCGRLVREHVVDESRTLSTDEYAGMLAEHPYSAMDAAAREEADAAARRLRIGRGATVELRHEMTLLVATTAARSARSQTSA